MTYRRGSQSVTPPWTWEISKWTNGQKKHFDTADGDVGFEPEHIDMTITFPGTGYAH